MSIHKQIMRAIMRQDMLFAVLYVSEVVWVHALAPNYSMAVKIASTNPDLRVYDIENETFL